MNALHRLASRVDKAVASVTAFIHLVASVVIVESALSWQITRSPSVSVTFVTVLSSVVGFLISVVATNVQCWPFIGYKPSYLLSVSE